MLGMGMTLTFADFREVLTTPRWVVLGVVAQFLIMPSDWVGRRHDLFAAGPVQTWDHLSELLSGRDGVKRGDLSGAR